MKIINKKQILLNLLYRLPFMLVGAWLVLSATNTTLICQRIEAKQGKCKLTKSSLSGSNTQEIFLDNLLGSKVTTNRKKSSRVVLLTKSGKIPFTDSYTRWGDKNEFANKINEFVENFDRKLIQLSQDDRWFGWIFGSIFVLGGVFGSPKRKN